MYTDRIPDWVIKLKKEKAALKDLLNELEEKDCLDVIPGDQCEKFNLIPASAILFYRRMCYVRLTEKSYIEEAKELSQMGAREKEYHPFYYLSKIGGVICAKVEYFEIDRTYKESKSRIKEIEQDRYFICWNMQFAYHKKGGFKSYIKQKTVKNYV